MPEIIKISHGLTIGDLKYGNTRPGVVEATLKPGETMEQALDELDERLNAWHRKRYPHLYQDDYGISNPPIGPISYTKESIIPPIIQTEETPDRSEIPHFIQACKTIEELTSYKLLASKEPLYSLYMQRLKELTNGPEKNTDDFKY